MTPLSSQSQSTAAPTRYATYAPSAATGERATARAPEREQRRSERGDEQQETDDARLGERLEVEAVRVLDLQLSVAVLRPVLGVSTRADPADRVRLEGVNRRPSTRQCGRCSRR